MRAQISVGAALPALSRLQKAGLPKAKPGSRRSTRYELTSAGPGALKGEMLSIAQEIPGDLEGILRVGYLLWLTGPFRLRAETREKDPMTPIELSNQLRSIWIAIASCSQVGCSTHSSQVSRRPIKSVVKVHLVVP